MTQVQGRRLQRSWRRSCATATRTPGVVSPWPVHTRRAGTGRRSGGRGCYAASLVTAGAVRRRVRRRGREIERPGTTVRGGRGRPRLPLRRRGRAHQLQRHRRHPSGRAGARAARRGDHAWGPPAAASRDL